MCSRISGDPIQQPKNVLERDQSKYREILEANSRLLGSPVLSREVLLRRLCICSLTNQVCSKEAITRAALVPYAGGVAAAVACCYAGTYLAQGKQGMTLHNYPTLTDNIRLQCSAWALLTLA